MRNLKGFIAKISWLSLGNIAVWICVDILPFDKDSTEAKIQITLLIVRRYECLGGAHRVHLHFVEYSLLHDCMTIDHHKGGPSPELVEKGI